MIYSNRFSHRRKRSPDNTGCMYRLYFLHLRRWLEGRRLDRCDSIGHDVLCNIPSHVERNIGYWRHRLCVG